MIVGIDATNIRAGGGLTHLLEVITHANPTDHQITKVIIWGGSQLDAFPTRPWLELRKIKALEGAIFRMSWIFFQSRRVFARHCDILWSPGGTFYSSTIPYISMSQNMLVFEKIERDRFPMSITKLRYWVLNFLQRRSFRHASGVIFLTQYARDYIKRQVSLPEGVRTMVIPHGVSPRFRHIPKVQLPISSYTSSKPFRILYVSIVNFYKHQVKLIEAVKILQKYYPVELVLIGPMNESCAKEFYNTIRGHEKFIIYKGKIDYYSLNEEYQAADMFAFCSTCENMPNILIEAMSSGLPILSSSYGPMPEVLQDGGIYCDPLLVEDIVNSLKELIEHPDVRMRLSEKSHELANKFSWPQCADETFAFISFCYQRRK